jgi:hypothetical protein
MKKLILKISHFFGYRLNEQLQEDISIHLSIKYSEPYDIEYEEYPNWIIEDVIEQVYEKFKSNKELEKRCRWAGEVWVSYYRSDIYPLVKHALTYIDGQIFRPNSKELERHRVLTELLNELEE